MTRNQILKPIVFAASLLPLANLVYGSFTASLGANPIERVTHATGWWTLTFLMITLAVSPLRKITGQLWLVQYRRMLGLFAFFYATLHMLTYVVADQSLDVAAMLRDVAKRPFITAGSLAFLLMVPLAITSTQGWIRRLGRNWQKLHRLIYASAIVGVVHFIWLVKKDVSEPLTFAAVLAILLGVRVVLNAKAKSPTKSERKLASVSAD